MTQKGCEPLKRSFHARIAKPKLSEYVERELVAQSVDCTSGAAYSSVATPEGKNSFP